MSSIYIFIFVTLYWLVPWNELPILLRGLPWFLLAASFSTLGGIDWAVWLFAVIGVIVTVFSAVVNHLNKLEDKNNES